MLDIFISSFDFKKVKGVFPEQTYRNTKVMTQGDPFCTVTGTGQTGYALRFWTSVTELKPGLCHLPAERP